MVVLGERECFACHASYQSESDKYLVRRVNGQQVHICLACFERARKEGARAGVGIAEGLELYSVALVKALLGSR